MTTREAIGRTKCQGCGAAVEVRLSANERAYYFCDGKADERACGHRATYGVRPTAALRAKAAPPSSPPPADPSPAADPPPAADDKPEGWGVSW